MKSYFLAAVLVFAMFMGGCQEGTFLGSNNYDGILKVGTDPSFVGTFANAGDGKEIISIIVISTKDDRIAASGLQINDVVTAIDYNDKPSFDLFAKACLAVSTGQVKQVVLTVKRNEDIMKFLVVK